MKARKCRVSYIYGHIDPRGRRGQRLRTRPNTVVFDCGKRSVPFYVMGSIKPNASAHGARARRAVIHVLCASASGRFSTPLVVHRRQRPDTAGPDPLNESSQCEEDGVKAGPRSEMIILC
ncbi:hypothetical protein EVAR_21460_1 [Eumeta japonica]|uniref:Uncharacterized protein n=1 Tax=Eumeta variegata TaxID=151549 RepID=A0A4C1VJ35_EUMVA|nr:hypothetical protein EVAR_21460_1 [Eumeta japonica]